VRKSLLTFIPLLAGCAVFLPIPGPTSAMGEPPEVEEAPVVVEAASPRGPSAQALAAGEAVAAEARKLLGRSSLSIDGQTIRFDCSGVVNKSYWEAGMDLGMRGTKGLFDLAQQLDVLHTSQPFPGDVAFFDNTYDYNRNGRFDDPLTHVAVVVDVEPDGRVVMVHKGSQGITWLYMHPGYPDQHSVDGRTVNSYVRPIIKSDGEGTPRLTSQLWRGYGSFWRADSLTPPDAVVDALAEDPYTAPELAL
jgi:hypothetical protein